MRGKSLLSYKRFAENLVSSAGNILLKYQNNVNILKHKDVQDICTDADIASEEFIIKKIRQTYPNHSIFSEEKGEIKSVSEFKWIIDPLDGTKEFVRGLPLYNCSISLEYKGSTVVATLYRPSEKKLFSASLANGSFLNGKKINTSKIKKIKNAFIYCYLPSYKRNTENYEWAWKKLSKINKASYRLRSMCDENSGLCWLAMGGCEAYLNLSNPPKWHDVAPGLFIAKEAGSVISDVKGNKIKQGKVNSVVACNSQALYKSLMKILN